MSPTPSAPLAPPPSANARTSRDAVDAGMRAMGLTAGAFMVPLAQLPLLQSDRTQFGHVGAASVAVILAELLVMLGLWLRPRSTTWLWSSGLLLFVASLWWMPHRIPLQAMNWWAPGFWAIAWVCWAVTVVQRRTFAVVVGSCLAVLTVLDPLTLLLQGLQVTPLRLAPVPWFTMPVAMMALFGYGLNQLATQADHQLERRRQAERSREEERALGDARREAARLLHDHVLHALHAISREAGQVPNQMVVDECRTAVAAIEQAGITRSMVELPDLLHADPVVAQVGAVVHGEVSPLPHDVARAMAAAAHEALTNVSHHAQATHVEVELLQRDSQWHVLVHDDGRGFDTTRLPQGRLGLRRSVLDRLEDAGGLATVDSAPGQGTTVHLVWPAPDEDAQSNWPHMGDAELGRVLTRTSWPALAITPLMALLAGGLLRPWWPLPLAAGGLLLLGLWWIRRLKTRPMSWRGQAVIFVVTSLAWWLNLWLAPPTMEVVYPLWMGWTAAGLMHLAVLHVPFRRGAAMLAGWSVVQLTALVLAVGWQQLPHLHISLNTGIGEGIIALVALRVARTVMDQNVAEAQVADAMRRSMTRLQADTHLQQFWSKRVTDVVLPLLRGIAERETDVASVRQRAIHLEATLRDELVLGPGHERLLDALNQLRTDGWMLRSTLSDDHGPDALNDFAALLTRMGPPAEPGQFMTLSSTGGHASAVVLGATDDQAGRWRRVAASVGGDCSVDPDFVRLRMPLDGRPVPEPEYMI